MKFGHLMTLRRFDGRAYMRRWGVAGRWGGVYLHRFDAPDPGIDLHDHPFSFVSVVLAGGYIEERADIREAEMLARIADKWPTTCHRGVLEHRGRWSVRALRLDECHRIVDLDRGRRCWTLVLRGPVRRRWGFYLPEGFMDESVYDGTVRAARRDLWNEVGS